DWIDGTGYTPDQVLDALRNGMGGRAMAAASPSPMTSSMTGMSGMPMPASPGSPGSPGATPAPSPVSSAPPSGPSPVLSGARSAVLGGDAGDVRYPWYLINGRVRTAPRTFSARPGQRARIRFINAAADTSFRVALGGHQMTVTHTDGYPVASVRADALLIGMGERYDVQVTLYDGVFPLTALAEGKNATALALVRTGAGEPPPPAVRPAELNGALASYRVLRAPPRAARGPGVIPRPARGPVSAAAGPHARRDLPAPADRRDGPLRLGHQRPGLRHVPPRRAAVPHGRGPAGPGDLRQHHHDVPPDAHPRAHLPAQPGRPAQGHGHRPPRSAGRLRLRRRQPRPVDDPLPQPLPRPPRRHDGHA